MSVSTMKKLTVLAYSKDADAIVRKLMDLKCVQIQQTADHREYALVGQGEGNQRAETEARLSRIRGVLPILSQYTRRRSTFGRRVIRVNRSAFLTDGRADLAWKTVKDAEELKRRLNEITSEQVEIGALMESLLPWLEYDAPLNEEGTAKTVVTLGSCFSKISPVPSLEAAGAHVETVNAQDGEWYLSVICHKDDEDAVNQAMVAYGFVKAAFPTVNTTAQAAYTRLEQRKASLEEEQMNLTERLPDVAEGLDGVEILYDIEQTTLNVCLQKQKLLQTEKCVVLEAWIPAVTVDAVAHTLSRFECATEVCDPEEGEEPPVLLSNNPFSQTFEWVIGMYSYPKYGTFDPTLIMSIFYFLIFGMMFADVGYGLLLSVACFAGVKLLNPKTGLKRSMLMFGYCGISCMLMGVLFGGWFGNLPTAIMNSFFPVFEGKAETTAIGSFFYNGLIFNPIDSSIGFLVLSLAVGEIHLIAGMAVNMVQTWKSGKRIEAICSTVPYWVLFAGLDLMAPTAVAGMMSAEPLSESTQQLLSTLAGVGGYVAIAGFLGILLLKGVGSGSFGSWLVTGLGGLYSLISYASDLLSYSRILALGLVASVIAQVINMLTGLGATGPIGFLFMLIVMIVGHGLNLVINLLGTFVHAARLQYIEFFGKFYEDGGEPFQPALPSEDYSEDCQDEPNKVTQ